jgi:hypothetical protein
LGGEYVLEALIQGVNDPDTACASPRQRVSPALADPASAQVLISALAEVGNTAVFDAARAGLVAMGERAWSDLIRAVNQRRDASRGGGADPVRAIATGSSLAADLDSDRESEGRARSRPSSLC